MMSNDEEKSVLLSVLAGIGMGAIIGAAAGLLFAPKSGPETREEIKKAAEDLKVKAEGIVEELTTSVDDLMGKSKELIDSTRSKVQTAVEAGKQAMSEKAHEIDRKSEEVEEA